MGITGRESCCSDRAPVHPHVRGDHVDLDEWWSAYWGSPPRAWGSRWRRVLARRRLRFTPTCVGITGQAGRHRPAVPVHPHVRGDHPDQRLERRDPVGSPPRAWGSLDRERTALPGARFTPTCVGITEMALKTLFAWTVHPHVRGDHGVDHEQVDAILGSPPRAWGSRIPSYRGSDFARFTPTCVGITAGSVSPDDKYAVHPHVRGDHFSHPVGETGRAGSPPRAWGSLARDRRCGRVCRFTPTCVGITS